MTLVCSFSEPATFLVRFFVKYQRDYAEFGLSGRFQAEAVSLRQDQVFDIALGVLLADGAIHH